MMRRRRKTGPRQTLTGVLAAAVLVSFCALVVRTAAAFERKARVAVLSAQTTATDAASAQEQRPGGIMGFIASLFSLENILASQLPTIKGVDVPEPETHYSYEEPVPERIQMELAKLSDEVKPAGLKDLDGPAILIYHTHTTEAYTQVEPYYVESGAWRTTDRSKSIVSIGEALMNELRTVYGYRVLHDATNHEPPKLDTAYSRSVATMEKYADAYPSLRVFIDVHRDAGNTSRKNPDVVYIDGKPVAKVMFVVGTGENYDVKPNYQENYKLALKATNELNAICEGLAKPVRVKSGRYNQHISDMCLLIEVGHNGNTREEALNAVPYIAKALDKAFSGS